jgi:hypothetical protein
VNGVADGLAEVDRLWPRWIELGETAIASDDPAGAGDDPRMRFRVLASDERLWGFSLRGVMAAFVAFRDVFGTTLRRIE